ncbi:MAG: hypothetical protein JWL81_214 [Verrucomicrobiales bacterium]|nr:hypothetical protein [Verrucomicrobiales bacterium]
MIFFGTDGIPEAQAGLMRHEIALIKMGFDGTRGLDGMTGKWIKAGDLQRADGIATERALVKLAK